MKKIAVITGASSGLGQAFVKRLVRKGKSCYDEIWMIARRKERMEAICKEYPKQVFKVLPLDLSEEESYVQYSKYLEEADDIVIGLLINNAGFGKIGDFATIPLKEQLGMIDVNIKAVTALTYISLNYMKKGSAIMNIASSAGFVPQRNFNVYGGTKNYVIHFTRALKAEIGYKGIRVTAVCPGPIETEFFERAGEIVPFKRFMFIKAESVVETALYDLKKNRDLSVAGWILKSVRIIAKVIPHGLVLRVTRKRR